MPELKDRLHAIWSALRSIDRVTGLSHDDLKVVLCDTDSGWPYSRDWCREPFKAKARRIFGNGYAFPSISSRIQTDSLDSL
jgi:hypothetical protein